MHIELSKDKRYYSIGEVAKAFNVILKFVFNIC